LVLLSASPYKVIDKTQEKNTFLTGVFSFLGKQRGLLLYELCT
jgi:hypothetical protein